MASLSIPNSFTNNTVASATEVNANFTSVKSFAESAVVQVDGSVQAPTAAIADGAITTDKIFNGTIMDVDINASAGIALSKMGSGALPTAITVASANIVEGTIVAGDIANGAVDKAKIGSGPRGIVAFTKRITPDTTIQASEIQVACSFTAVAERYYRITYFEPLIVTSTVSQSFVQGIIAINEGVQLESSTLQNPRTDGNFINGSINVTIVTTLPAGAITINGILFSNFATAQANRYSVQPAYICVEDIGTL